MLPAGIGLVCVVWLFALWLNSRCFLCSWTQNYLILAGFITLFVEDA
jgi:hypothetical protein